MLNGLWRWALRKRILSTIDPRSDEAVSRLQAFIDRRPTSELAWLAALDPLSRGWIRQTFEQTASAEWSLAAVRLVATACDPNVTQKAFLQRLAEAGASPEAIAVDIIDASEASPHGELALGHVLNWFTNRRLLDARPDLLAQLVRLGSEDLAAGRDPRALATEVRLQTGERGSLRRSDAWLRYMQARDKTPVLDLQDAIRAAVSAADLDELAAVVEDVDEEETTLILSLLSHLERESDPRLQGRVRDTLAAVLARRADHRAAAPWRYSWVLELAASMDPSAAMARLEDGFARERRLDTSVLRGLQLRAGAWPPDLQVSWQALLGRLVQAAIRDGSESDVSLEAWLQADRTAVVAYLVHDLDLGGQIPPRSVQVIIRGLLAIGTNEAIARLRVLSEAASESSPAATTALQAIGHGDQRDVEALAARWRATRSAEPLRQLVYTYLHWLPAGFPLDRWRGLLGRAREYPTQLWYDSSEGPGLLICLDGQGGMESWKYK